MAHRLLVTGSVACFSRPDMQAERVTYDVITPMAARRIFEAVHWTPAIWWHVEKIEVLQPIRTEWRDGLVNQPTSAMVTAGRRRSLCLIDVSYMLVARFALTPMAEAGESPAQHAAMFKRRARSQRFFRTPHLGGRDMPAQTRLLSADEVPSSFYAGQGAIDLGWTVFDRDRDDRDNLRFYRPVMIDGVIDLTSIDPTSLPR